MRFSEEEKSMWLSDWRQSGKSAWAYAKENGLVPQTFVRWTKTGKKPPHIAPAVKHIADNCEAMDEHNPRFVEVTPGAIQPFVIPREIFIEKGGVKIHVPLTIGSSELRVILTALREAV